MNIIGIDAGSSLIKIVEVNGEKNIINKIFLEKMPIKEALDIFIKKYNINLSNIKKIVLTGVGVGEIDKNFYNIQTTKVDEFIAIGTGGAFLTNKKEALIISVGTGTAFVRIKENCITHIGGTGVGGGAFFNLCKTLTNEYEIDKIKELINNGNINNVNFTIQDVSTKDIKTLPKDITAVNCGKLTKQTEKEDVVLGILNMVIETIGMMAAFAVQNQTCKEVVLIGNIITFPKVEEILKKIETIQNIKFIVPQHAEFGTILGAIQKSD